MCLSAAEVSPLCDECFWKLNNLGKDEEFEPCETCKKFLKHYCDCCMTYKPDEIVEESLCRECRQEFDIE
jgi:hypothetical protein